MGGSSKKNFPFKEAGHRPITGITRTRPFWGYEFSDGCRVVMVVKQLESESKASNASFCWSTIQEASRSEGGLKAEKSSCAQESGGIQNASYTILPIPLRSEVYRWVCLTTSPEDIRFCHVWINQWDPKSGLVGQLMYVRDKYFRVSQR